MLIEWRAKTDRGTFPHVRRNIRQNTQLLCKTWRHCCPACMSRIRPGKLQQQQHVYTLFTCYLPNHYR